MIYLWQGQIWSTGKVESSPSNIYHCLSPSLNCKSHGLHNSLVTKPAKVLKEFEMTTY